MAEQPKNVRVTYRIGATVNLGDFNNVKPEFEISADVPDGTNPKDVKDRLVNVADAWLDKVLLESAGKKIVTA